MKQILAILSLTASIFAQANNVYPPKLLFESSTVNYSINFNKLVINDEINVILQEGFTKEFIVSGNVKDINKLQWCIKNGTLTVALKSGNIKDKITLLITVGSLKEIEVNSHACITNLGSLSTPLRIQANASCDLALKSLQPIVIAGVAASEIDLKQKNGRIIFE